MTEKHYPKLPCWQAYQYGNAVVWCRYCIIYHLHALDDPGHRVAHCHVKASAYHDLGYILVDAGTAPPEIEKDLKRQDRGYRWTKRHAFAESYAVSECGKIIRVIPETPIKRPRP